MKAAVNTKIEQKLASLNTVSKPVNLPTDYYDQGLDIHQVLEELDIGSSSDKKEFNIEYMFQLLQKCVMNNDLNFFLNEVHTNIENLL